jgi:phosphoglycolate phosphatase-like HAD superfamily hydrolase
MPPAAILDVDGTLVDTNYHHAIAWYRAFRQHGELLPIWRIHRHIGMGGDHHVESLCGEAVVVGDSTRDCEAAGRAGISTLSVLTGGFSEAELHEAGAVAVYHSIVELRNSLDEWLTS